MKFKAKLCVFLHKWHHWDTFVTAVAWLSFGDTGVTDCPRPIKLISCDQLSCWWKEAGRRNSRWAAVQSGCVLLNNLLGPPHFQKELPLPGPFSRIDHVNIAARGFVRTFPLFPPAAGQQRGFTESEVAVLQPPSRPEDVANTVHCHTRTHTH